MSKTKRRITVEDLYKMEWASDPQISPDGKFIAYVVKTVDQDDLMKYQNHIWLVPTDGSKEPYQFTNIGSSETNPRWSPDSKKLAFTAKHGKYTQIWTIPVDGGAPLPLTQNDFNTGAPVWSPDGCKIAFTAKVTPENSEEEKKSDVKYITNLHYKANGVGFLGDKVSQVFVYILGTQKVTQLTSGIYNCNDLSWSPCSKYLAFSSNRTEDHEYNHISDIWTVSIEGGPLTKLTASEGPARLPSWSPDGRYIAYVGHHQEYSSATINTIYLKSTKTGETFDLLPNFEQAPNHGVGGDSVSSPNPGIIWSKDGDQIYFLSSGQGKTAVYRVKAERNAQIVALTSGDEVLYGMSYSAQSNRFAVLRSTFTSICDVFTFKEGEERQKLSNMNKSLLDEVVLSEPEKFTYQFEKFNIDGWIMKPIGFKAGVKYPTILEIHGGPHSAYGHIFFHEFQLLAAAGYVVVFTNPPGSSNYGQEFLTQTHHDWGGLDYRSLMAAVDYVNETYDFVDSQTWGVTGGSYGGYMVNWMIGQTDFFKAGVSMRSTCNRYSQFGTSDVGFFNGIYEQKGNPWDNPEFYLKVSPISYVNKVNTPLMLIASENDLRCPISQSEEFFTALKWLKKEVVMVRFPDETHELSRSGKPAHRTERLQHMLNWFTDHISVNPEDYQL